MQFHRMLIWHPARSSPACTNATRTSPRTRQRCILASYNAPAKPGNMACRAFNHWKCDSVWDITMADSSLHIGVRLDNVSSGLSDSSKVSSHFSILSSHLPGVEDLAASPPCTPVAEGEVHADVTGVVPPGPPPVDLPFRRARGCIRGAGITCHEQCQGAPADSPVHMVLCTCSQAGPPLLQASFQTPQAGSTLAETGFNHPHLFPGQAKINTHEGNYIKAETSDVVLSVDSTHTVSTNHLDSIAPLQRLLSTPWSLK